MNIIEILAIRKERAAPHSADVPLIFMDSCFSSALRLRAIKDGGNLEITLASLWPTHRQPFRINFCVGRSAF